MSSEFPITKEQLSVLCGYFPASQAAFLHDTYGLHPIDMLKPLADNGLRMDWEGFRYEMAKRGADVAGLVEEGRRFEALIAKRARA